jgi:polysaccharide biosynthesis/export protein
MIFGRKAAWTARSHHWSRVLLLLAASMVLTPLQAATDYRLNVGDVLEITVTGAPELQRRAAVNLNGEISLPLIGEIHAAGSTLTELRSRVREILSQVEYHPGRSVGISSAGTVTGAIKSEEVSLTIVEYRPIYLTGDVALPGEKPYRPGMSVRQAISVAGGFDIARSRMSNALLDSSDMRGQYESLSTELVREKARAWRLQNELGRKATIDQSELPPINPEAVSKIMRLEEEQLKIRQVDFQKEKDHLRDLIAQTDQKIKSMNQQYQNEEEGTKIDIEEMDRTKVLLDKGLIPITRFLETRRATLMSATRSLQTKVQLEEAQRYREELKMRLTRMDDQRSINVVEELQTSNLRATSLQATIHAIGEKLFYMGAAKSQMVLASSGSTKIVVFRYSEKGRERIDADEDTQVLPGDVIEVAVDVRYESQFATDQQSARVDN